MKKEFFSSRAALLLALIGNAVGLGNIWRVSYLFSYHGSVFFIAYLVFVFLIGLPLVYLELKLAEKYRKNVKYLYEKFEEKHNLKVLKFRYLYILPLATIFIISIYYSIVVANVLKNVTSDIFDIHEASIMIVWALTLFAVFRGIKGIEQFNTFFMLLLFILLVYLFINVKSLPNLFSYPTANFTEAIKQALVQVLFSLSIGTGLLYTYSVYSKKYNTFENAIFVTAADTLIAVMSLLIIFSIVYQPGIFVAFENVKQKFSDLNLSFLTPVFFLALFSAGFTSLIALVKFVYDNSSTVIVFSAFILSLIFYFLPDQLGGLVIEFLDSVVATTLFILNLPITVIVFYNLLKEKNAKR
jgi:NSS family neurotransmitter:Na+ symporter